MFVMIMQSHQASTGAQAPVDFRKVPGHGQGPQPGLEVTGAPEGGKRARECKKMEDEGVYMSVKNLLTYLEGHCTRDSEFYMFLYIIFDNLIEESKTKSTLPGPDLYP